MSTTPKISGATAKPRTFHGDLAHLPAALLPLTQQKRWVIWRWEQRGPDKRTKPPFQPQYPKRAAKANDPATWGSYKDAVLAFTAGERDGIGFMLKDSDLGAIDLDHIRDFATGQVLRWAEELFVEAANAGCYLEWTVSGTGARIIGIVRGSELHRKINLNRKTGCAVEFYQHCARYITISGVQISGDYPGLPVPTEMAEYDALFDALFVRFRDNVRQLTPQDCEFRGGMHIGIEEIRDEDGDQNRLDFNTADLQDTTHDETPDDDQVDYEDLIQNSAAEGKRSEEFARVVWHLASRGKSAEEIAEELAQHPSGIGSKYTGRLQAEVNRSYSKWSARKQAGVTGSAATAGGSPWPQIKIIPSELPRVVNEAEEALLDLGREIYQRGGLLVRPAISSASKGLKYKIRRLQLIPIDRPHLVEALCCAARFLRYSERKKAWVPTDAPDKVAETLASRIGSWKFPNLEGIVSTPFLRVDGSLCEQPGYDPESEILFKPDGQSFPPIPQEPTKEDAAAALAKLDRLIQTFPFIMPSDRSVALAGILTALDRRSMDTAPLIAFTAPAAGTGKSLLVDIIALLATGRRMPVIAQGRTEEELEKRLGSALLAGDVAISIDNCEHELKSSLLCQALTQSPAQHPAARSEPECRNPDERCLLCHRQ
jgi:hypothetical protein